MGATYAFLPRRRTLRGMGQDIAPPDIGMPSFPSFAPLVPDVPQPAPPPFVFVDVKPTIPTPVVTPVTPPNLGPSPIPGVKFVFPAGGPVPPPPQYAAAAPSAGWLSQQMIAGVPNSYLALATVGLVLFVSMSSAKRRR